MFIIYPFRFAFIAPGISPLDFFVFRKLSLQKFGVNIHDVSIRATTEELSTHFAENKIIIDLVHRLPIASNARKHVPFGLES